MNRISSRAMLIATAFVLFLVPVAGIAAGGFTDVDDDNVFVADIQWMKDNGITKGCNPPTNDKFCPDKPVTRQQMSAFMHRLAVEQVVDAGTLQGLTAAEIGSGSGSNAAGAAGRYGSGDDPTVLTEDTPTELGALVIDVPASGGVVNITTSVMLDVDGPASQSFVSVAMTWDKSCSSSDGILAGALADVANVLFANVPLNSGVSPSAGNHTIRLCATAFHVNASDVTWVDAARISTVWAPTAMGGTVPTLAANSLESGSDYSARAEAMRDSWLSKAQG